MPSYTGARGSSHRKAVICGLIAVGTAVLLLSGLMMESSIKQVYWAVYSRVHPMRGDSESYSESRIVRTTSCLDLYDTILHGDGSPAELSIRPWRILCLPSTRQLLHFRFFLIYRPTEASNRASNDRIG